MPITSWAVVNLFSCINYIVICTDTLQSKLKLDLLFTTLLLQLKCCFHHAGNITWEEVVQTQGNTTVQIISN